MDCWIQTLGNYLELSNNSYVNIQIGKNGFSLKEFNESEIKGENILDAIDNTWGHKTYPVSFYYLGDAKYDYEKLKKILSEEKEKEKKVSKKMEKHFSILLLEIANILLVI